MANFVFSRPLFTLVVIFEEEEVVVVDVGGNLVRLMEASIHHDDSISFNTTRDFSVSIDSRGTPLEKLLGRRMR